MSPRARHWIWYSPLFSNLHTWIKRRVKLTVVYGWILMWPSPPNFLPQSHCSPCIRINLHCIIFNSCFRFDTHPWLRFYRRYMTHESLPVTMVVIGEPALGSYPWVLNTWESCKNTPPTLGSFVIVTLVLSQSKSCPRSEITTSSPFATSYRWCSTNGATTNSLMMTWGWWYWQ